MAQSRKYSSFNEATTFRPWIHVASAGYNAYLDASMRPRPFGRGYENATGNYLGTLMLQ